jgi:hypothetical protein
VVAIALGCIDKSLYLVEIALRIDLVIKECGYEVVAGV